MRLDIHTHILVCAEQKTYWLVGTQRLSSSFFNLFSQSIVVDQIYFPTLVCAIK